MTLLPDIPEPLEQTAGEMLEFTRLRELVASFSGTDSGRDWTLALTPSRNAGWAAKQHQRVEESLRLLRQGSDFDFHGLFDPTALLERARISGEALEIDELRSFARLVDRFRAFQQWQRSLPEDILVATPALRDLTSPILETPFAELLNAFDGKFESDGSVSDHASRELAQIRRRIERQHRSIEDGLRQMLRKLGPEGSLQEDLITVRGERFVLPVKAEWKRRVPGVMHGASSSGQTFFIEPLETIEQNNELQRLLEEEQAEVRRILAAMTRQIAEHASSIARGAAVLTETESIFARARFAQDFACAAPVFSLAESPRVVLKAARHPLLEQRLRAETAGAAGGVRSTSQNNSAKAVVPLDLELPSEIRQLIISGPNTGGKTVALKTVGLIALMAQSGIPVPAETAELPIFDAVLADIGDAQSIAQNLSTFSAHILRLNAIAARAGSRSLVLLDELGSATDPEEGAALAAAVASRFVELRAWCLISTHHTSLKVYAANTAGVQNAAAGFEEESFAPTYRIRVGVPGVSAGIHIAQRLGLDPKIVANAKERLGKQSIEIGKFLDRLNADLLAVNIERAELQRREGEIARERQRLEQEGRLEQQKKVREMEAKLGSLLQNFEFQIKETLRGVEDRAARQKTAKQAERGLAKLRREFREQIDATVVAHKTGADQNDPNAQPHIVRSVNVGDTVQLRSLGKNAVVERQMDNDNFEVSVGALKMRIRRGDIAAVVSHATDQTIGSPLVSARNKGIRVSIAREPGAILSEINVIGRTVEEATDAVEKFLDQAFLEGLPRVRIVHGSGMGILRKALRAYLSAHPHIATVTQPPQNQGGEGVTIADFRE